MSTSPMPHRKGYSSLPRGMAGVDRVYHAGEQVEFSVQQEQHWMRWLSQPCQPAQPDVNVTINVRGGTPMSNLWSKAQSVD
ncbi:MAG: hypothetical protein R3C18_17545 [Planctomycetaceae bacterium]